MLSSQLCSSEYHIKGVFLCFLLFLIVNAMCYLLMLRFDVKKGFSNTATNKTVLSFWGISKVFISVCIIIFFSFLRISLSESISFFKQNVFFQNNNDLNYISFIGKMNQSSEEDLIDYSEKYYTLCNRFYQQYQNDAVILDWVSDIDNYCVMNMNSAALKKFNNDIKLVDKSIKVSYLLEENAQVVFIPEQISKQSINRIMGLKSNDSEIRLIEYKRLETVCIGADHNYISSYETAPVVFLNFAYSSPRTVLYQVSENDVKNFLKPYFDSAEQWEYKIDNATEMYNIYKSKIKNMVLVYSGLIISLIVIAVMTIMSITKFYFIFHKAEFALKYCLGYNFIQFLSFPFGFSVIILFVSFVCAVILSLILKLNLSMNLVYGAGLVLFMDCVTLLFFYFNFIQKNIVQILKGKAI